MVAIQMNSATTKLSNDTCHHSYHQIKHLRKTYSLSLSTCINSALLVISLHFSSFGGFSNWSLVVSSSFFFSSSFMERASSLRGKSEVPPVAAELWMSGKALRRPVLAEDAKLVTTDSTSVIFDESVLIATSAARRDAGVAWARSSFARALPASRRRVAATRALARCRLYSPPGCGRV